MDDLIERLKKRCAGRERWYVMNAAEDGYIIDFDWQLDADRWMDRYMRENPDFIERNGYHVVKQKVFTAAEELANEAIAALEAANARIAQLEAARIAYASEFAPDAEGLPDVGSIHANIRAMKKDAARYRWLRDVQADAGDFQHASLDIYLSVPEREPGAAPRKHAECFDAAIDHAIAKELS